MKVALFGGSFNPIHNGHLGIARELVAKGMVDEVWLIPCGNHAFDKKLESGEDRMKMINLAIKGNSSIKAIGIELKSKEKSYTSDTISLLKKEFSHDFYFVMGSDNLKDLEKWHDFGYLKNNIKFILVRRPSFEFSNNSGVKIESTLDIKNNTSSSIIRNNLKNGISVKKFVPKEVEQYIKKRGLYRE